ncbi:MAG: hypothetical protein FVQ77_08075 [Cytophagales bacterium]|nr:hypothetical protein [Cytophagales bacterium]
MKKFAKSFVPPVFSGASFATMLICIMVAVSSCKKEPDYGNPTLSGLADKDSVDLTTVARQVAGDVNEGANSESGESLENLVDLLNTADPLLRTVKGEGFKGIFERTKLKIKSAIRNLPFRDKLESAKIASDTSGNFCFDCHWGTYTWVPIDSGYWHYTPGGNTITMKFPADKNSPVNNAVLTIGAYTEIPITTVDEFGFSQTNYYPTSLVVDLKVNNIPEANLNYTGTFDSEGMPLSIKLTIYFKPFTLSFIFSNQPTTVSFDLSLSKDGAGVMYAVGGTGTFTDASKDFVKTIEGYVQLYKLKLETSSPVDVETLNDIDLNTGITAADLNKYVNIDLFYNTLKIGELFFIDIIDPIMGIETQVYIKFNSGKVVLAETYLCIVEETVCTDFGGQWDQALCECL